MKRRRASCSLYCSLDFAMAVIKPYPGSKKVHEDEREFARLVGECITTWAFVDREVFRLSGCTSKRQASARRLSIIDGLPLQGGPI
jgi:hypothetical protein